MGDGRKEEGKARNSQAKASCQSDNTTKESFPATILTWSGRRQGWTGLWSEQQDAEGRGHGLPHSQEQHRVKATDGARMKGQAASLTLSSSKMTSL